MGLFARTRPIDAAGTADLLAARSAVLVDVREQAEWNAGHIKGAVHLPLTHLSSRLPQLPIGRR